jgi:hypothetical protein
VASDLVLVAVLLIGPPMLREAQPGKPEQLPRPRIEAPALPEPVLVLPSAPFQRVNRYDVWQSYSVDRQGHFRARVISSPSGDYYHHNGQPYPWSTVHPLRLSPLIVH